MKNKLKSVKKGSKTAAASQPKTAQSKASVRPPSLSPSIALFTEADGGASEEAIDLSVAEYAALKRAAAPAADGVLMFMANAALEKAGRSARTGHKSALGSNCPACVCIYDGSVRELVCEIPLTAKLLGSVVANPQRIHVDQFIAEAIREKLARSTGSAAPSPAGSQADDAGGYYGPRMSAHEQLSAVISEAITIIDLLSDAYWQGINKENESQWMRANGLAWLAQGVSDRLESGLPLAEEEYKQALLAKNPAAGPSEERRAA